ncbi:MAG: hypothetical protein R3257_07030 [bacterium]|nr:hypothetical protein [bacterium]
MARALAEKILETEDRLEDHPDFFLVEPDNGRIKIDTIREIKKSLPFEPLKGRGRVVLINNAHTMNHSAANALLKSLEEPPVGTFFILVSHAPGWLPQTIVSRTQKFRFSPLSPEALEKILRKEERELPAGMLPWAQGSAALALTLAQIKDQVPSLRSLLPSREALSFDGAYALSQEIAEAAQVNQFLQALLLATHQVLTGPRKNQKYDFDLLNFCDRILAIQGALRQNINPKLNLHRLLMYFQEPKLSRYE